MTFGSAIFVVDDDPRMRDSLRWLLESVDLSVETYGSATQFLDIYDPGRPGCLLLDIRMPGMSGLQLQDLLAAKGIQLPIIIITGYGDVPTAVRAVQKGAVDFIEKPFNDQLLLDRIHYALALDDQRRQAEAERGTIQDRIATLTPRERDVLEHILTGEQNKVIAATLGISMKTVEVHRARIMKKMAATSLAHLVATCIAADVHPGKP
jgi:two-component system, LuxR family, response regulator FixJ